MILKLSGREIITNWDTEIIEILFKMVYSLSLKYVNRWSLKKKKSKQTNWRTKITLLNGPTCKNEVNSISTKTKQKIMDISNFEDYLKTHLFREMLYFLSYLLIKALTSNTALGHSSHLSVPEWSLSNQCNTCECNG